MTLILWIYPSLTRQTKTLSFIWGLAIFFYFQEAQTVITGMWGSPRRVNNLVFLQTDEKYLLWRNRVLVNKNFMQIALKKKTNNNTHVFPWAEADWPFGDTMQHCSFCGVYAAFPVFLCIFKPDPWEAHERACSSGRQELVSSKSTRDPNRHFSPWQWWAFSCL